MNDVEKLRQQADKLKIGMAEAADYLGSLCEKLSSDRLISAEECLIATDKLSRLVSAQKNLNDDISLIFPSLEAPATYEELKSNIDAVSSYTPSSAPEELSQHTDEREAVHAASFSIFQDVVYEEEFNYAEVVPLDMDEDDGMGGFDFPEIDDIEDIGDIETVGAAENIEETVDNSAEEAEPTPLQLLERRLTPTKFTDEELAMTDELIGMGINLGIRGQHFDYSIQHGDERVTHKSRQIRSDLEKNHSGNLTALANITGFGMNTLSPDCDMTTPLQSLFRLGYVKKLEIEGRSPIYLPSRKTAKTLRNVSCFRNNINSHLRFVALCAEQSEIDENLVTVNNNIICALGEQRLVEILASDGSIAMLTDTGATSQLGAVIKDGLLSANGRNAMVMYIGCAMAGREIVKHLVQSIELAFCVKDRRAVFVAADTISEAEIMGSFIKKLYDECISEVILYGVTEDRLAVMNEPDADVTDSGLLRLIVGDLTSQETQEVSDTAEPAETADLVAADFHKIEEHCTAEQPEEAAPAWLPPDEEADESSSDSALLTEVKAMIADGRSADVCGYLSEREEQSPDAAALRREFAYAVHDMAYGCKYTSNEVLTVYDVPDNDFTPLRPYLYVSAALRALFYNYSSPDYIYSLLYHSLKDYAKEISSETAVLLAKLAEFRGRTTRGVDFYADYRFVATQEKTAERAKKLLAEITPDESNAVIRNILGYAVYNITEGLYEAEDFLYSSGIIAKNAEISSDFIRLSVLEAYCENSGISAECVVTAADWVQLVKRGELDVTVRTFAEDKKSIAEQVNRSIEQLQSNNETGAVILLDTLKQLHSRLDGSFSRNFTE